MSKITEKVGKAEEKTRKWLGKLGWGIASILIIMALFGKFDDAAAEAGIAGKADNREVTAEYTRDDGTKGIAVKTTDNTWVDENITTPSVKEKEVSEQEMVEISTDIEESVTESIEESTWGEPEKEEFLKSIGFNMSEIQSKEHLLYVYYVAKIICEDLEVNSMEEIRNYAYENIDLYLLGNTDFDTSILDTMLFFYKRGNLVYVVEYTLGDDFETCYNAAQEYLSSINDEDEYGFVGDCDVDVEQYSEYTLLDSSNVKDFFRTAQAGDKVEFYGEANVITDDLVYIHIFDQQYAVFDIVIENYNTRLFTDDKVHITGTFTGFMLNTPVVSVESIQIN